ncbi:hypothetical protein Taro_012372 [Colocasia esculenta]|uniref:Uncharacterized protein n=1 Tax=Colocasia esculenta TaxID=4460 RepID=A0A843UCN7_COLES|nr:hypothetical protein [Colocasia esculenta]
MSERGDNIRGAFNNANASARRSTGTSRANKPSASICSLWSPCWFLMHAFIFFRLPEGFIVAQMEDKN